MRNESGRNFLEIKQTPARLNRSQLFVLANRPETLENAAASEADVVKFEIEHAVPPDEKPQARENIVEALNDIDWGQKSISMHIVSIRRTCTAISFYRTSRSHSYPQGG
jgi:malyl-CoA/(S)-citramalyl-CoA lyase